MSAFSEAVQRRREAGRQPITLVYKDRYEVNLLPVPGKLGQRIRILPSRSIDFDTALQDAQAELPDVTDWETFTRPDGVKSAVASRGDTSE